MKKSGGMTTVLSASTLALVAGVLPASAADRPPATPTAAASFLAAGALTDVSGVAADSATGRQLKAQGFAVMKAPSGRTAVVDRSSAHEGITTATGPSFVELSWKGYAADARYVVTRDGRPVAQLPPGAVSFRDTTVRSGRVHHYQVAPVLPEGGDPRARLWGVKASVPASGSLTGLRKQASALAAAAGTAATSTLTWTTFIPQAKVAAPTAGCDYGPNFQFGGDGRSNFDWRSSKYRTSLNAVVTWRSKAVSGHQSVGSTTVYRKSDGRKIATKTAGTGGMKVKKLGSGANHVDVRMTLHATNPFCRGLGGVKGAISGAFTMNLTKSGNYAIRSGKHRLMPNHHIYLYDGGRVTNVYTRKYADARCLVGSIACAEADLTGYRGSF
ncbi:hypothetical protein [Streptomyces sp. NPDC049906]|uniref:hypothetical protein n=1 Tax=Streptomyces sp. NPDC049906 TaxID=3155656 RepID=UPI00342CF6D2